MSLLDRHALRFVALSFGFSWVVGGVLALTGGFAPGARQVIGGFIFMMGPAVAALVVTRGQRMGERRDSLGLRVRFDRWLVVAWLVPTLVIVLAMLGAGLLPGTRLVSPAAALVTKITELSGPTQAAKLAALPQALISIGLVFQTFMLGPLLNAPFMLSEELGWRGYLWSRWQGLGFWTQSLATGVVWGLWHGPIILMGYNFPDAPVLGVALMVVFCVLLAPLFQLLRQRGGTIWHACLCHGAINAGARLSDLCVTSDHWYGRGLLGVPGFSLLALTCAVVGVVQRHGAPSAPAQHG